MAHRSRPPSLRLCLVASAAAFALTAPALAETPDQIKLPDGAQAGDYVGSDVMIPMRDGVKLHAEVWRPKNQAGPLPMLIERSPYGFGLRAAQASFASSLKELAADGYVFVLEDIRGKFGSEGDFVMLRPETTSPKGTDESTDTYDTIGWLVKNLPDNNGRAGVLGVSYGGWTSAIATIHPHPALKAVSVQASPEDMFLGDDFHHNGAFRLDYAWEYATTLETDPRILTIPKFDEDPYDFYLKQGALDGYDQKLVGKPLPTWRNFVGHPNDDAYWQANVTSHMMPATPSVPDLIVAGWWDQEDFYGPVTIYERQAKGDTANRNFIVIGPWHHGGWAGGGEKYGPYDLGGDTSAYFRAQVQAPWFHYWLKGGDKLDEPRALVFETGSNTWHGYSAWPPKDGVVEKRLYLHAGGKLSFDPPSAADAEPDRFVSDPASPVPYRPKPITPVIAQGSTWPNWLADDQSSFDKRPDVLSFRTDVLDQDVAIRGEAIAKLFASTTGTDADWIVKLIDVYPNDDATPAELRGRELIVSDEVFRGRFREGFEHPRPLTPNKALDYSIDLHTASHRFLKGHRIEVQIQSSWFPLIDRNPQVFTPSIYTADPSTFKKQTHAVFHSAAYPSAILLDVPSGD